MEGISGILQGILSLGNEFQVVYLDSLEDHQVFSTTKTGDTDDLLQLISSLLLKPDSRPVGLRLLKMCLKQCTVEVVDKKLVLWSTLTLKSCNVRELETHGCLVFDALRLLAEMAQLSTELTKAFASSCLGKIYDALIHVPPSGYLAALECIESCLRLYPGSSGPATPLIEKFLTKLIDINDEDISRCSGKCRHLLLQVRGGGVQGQNHKTQWQIYQLKLLGSLHVVLDNAFANCTELYDGPVESELLNLPALELSDEPVRRAMQLYIRFRNLVDYLITAICEPFPVAKPICPKKILNLIIRGLSVTCLTLQQNFITDNLALGALLPKMHLYLLRLLKACIMAFCGHLRVHHALILDLLVGTLKWTSSRNADGLIKPYSNLRSEAFELISLWSQALSSGSRVETVAGLLIEEIFNDAVPYQTGFKLKVSEGARKHMSKKARRQLHKLQNEQSNLAQAHSSNNSTTKASFSEEGNRVVCAAALRCLYDILLVSSDFLKPTLLKTIQIKILQICGLFYELPLKPQQLYSDEVCRIHIYNVLYVLTMSPHHLCPPPAQMSFSILQAARLRDPCSRVRHHCGTLLYNLEKLLHPQKEGLMFPIDVRNIRNAFIKLGQERLLDQNHIGMSSIDCQSDGSDSDADSNSLSNCQMKQQSGDEHSNSMSNIQHDLSEQLERIELTLANTKEGEIASSSEDTVDNDDNMVGESFRCSETTSAPSLNDEADGENKEAVEHEDILAPPEAKRPKIDCVDTDPEYTIKSIDKVNADIDENLIEAELEASEAKRPKVDSGDTEPEDTIKSIDKVFTDMDEDQIVAELEASFVDELN